MCELAYIIKITATQQNILSQGVDTQQIVGTAISKDTDLPWPKVMHLTAMCTEAAACHHNGRPPQQHSSRLGRG